MPVTVQIDDQANALVEAFVGHARSIAPGKRPRVDKRDVVSAAVKEYVENHLPAAILRELSKANPS